MPEIFASIITVIAGFLIYFSLLGFDNYNILIIKSIFVSFFLIYTPHFVKANLLSSYYNTWYNSKPFLLFVCLILLVIAGQTNINLEIDFSYLFIGLGIFVFLAVIIDNNKNNNNQKIIFLYLLFLIIGIWSTSAYLSQQYYYHPLIKEKIITGAQAHRDAVWGASIAGMFKTYGVASTGLDGLVPFYYHNLAYFVYGSLSGLLSINTITFFNTNVPILIIPIFFLAFIFCVKEVNGYYSSRHGFYRLNENNKIFWILFSVLFILPLPVQVFGYFGGELYYYLTSPSYLIALLLTFVFIGVIFSFINLKNNCEKDISRYNKVFFVGTIVLLYFFICISKVSFLYVLGSIYGYLFFRLKYYKDFYHILAMIGFIGVVIFVYYYIINTETFLKSSYQVVSADLSFSQYILFIWPSLIFISMKLYRIKIKSVDNLIEKIKTTEILDIEILILLIFILFPVPFQYFKGIQIYLAYILILSHTNMFSHLFISKNPIPPIN